jgi:ribosome recycling factor
MSNDILKNTEAHMTKTLDAFKHELLSMRAGRAHPGLLENVKVDYYGTQTPLSRVANINVSDARTLTVSPWDKNMTKAIEKAIQTADLGLNPIADGAIVRIPLPPLTEERRKELIKVVKNQAEQAKIAVRNIRRDSNNELKNKLKEKTLSEDEEHRAQEKIQKLTDKFIGEIDQLTSVKEEDLLKG